MATEKTRDELVDRALKKLLMIGAGQSPEAEDQETVDDMVDAVLADLAERGVVYVGNPEAIPVAIFEHLADCLAQAAAPDFGLPRDASVIAFAEGRLRVIAASRPSGEPQQTDYF